METCLSRMEKAGISPQTRNYFKAYAMLLDALELVRSEHVAMYTEKGEQGELDAITDIINEARTQTANMVIRAIEQRIVEENPNI